MGAILAILLQRDALSRVVGIPDVQAGWEQIGKVSGLQVDRGEVLQTVPETLRRYLPDAMCCATSTTCAS